MTGRFRFVAIATVVAAVLGVGGASSAWAAGEIGGQVQNDQGQPAAGAAVKLIVAGKSQDQASDAQGNFKFDNLASGNYVVTVALDGYEPVTCPGVRILASLSRTFAIKLVPAGGEARSSCQDAAPANP
jgi:hypothetical protein